MTGEDTPAATTAAAAPGSTGRQRLLFTLLYFSEGVPIGFLWWALPAVLREQSLDLASITALTAALAIPWTLKFLAGPFIDGSVARGGRLRTWIITCQLAMGLSLAPLAMGAGIPTYGFLFALLLVHACFAAVQDVAIDALCIRSVPARHLGSINGWMQFGMTAGRALAAASVPLLINWAGWNAAIWTIVALIWTPMLAVLLLVREPASAPGAESPWRFSLAGVFTWALLPAMAVALLAGSGFEATGALAGPLLVDLGTSATQRAVFFGALAPAGLAIGGLAAATLADRLGLVRSVRAGVLYLAVAVAALALSLADDPDAASQQSLALLTAIYLGAGFLISSSYACFMRVARGKWGATRFSLLMALTNACESGSAFAVGRLSGAFGPGGAIAALAAVSLLSLPFIGRLGEPRENEHATK